MKVYAKVVLDMQDNFKPIEEVSYLHFGDCGLCKGGGGGSTVESVDYMYNARMANIAEEQQIWARDYYNMWSKYGKPYEIAQYQSNMEMLPYEKDLYKNQLIYADKLLPQQYEVANNYLKQSLNGVNINERVGLATADMSNSFKGMQEENLREQARLGVNPNSGRFAGISAAMNTAKASQMAGAATGARVGAEQENYERLQKANQIFPSSNFVQGLGFMG